MTIYRAHQDDNYLSFIIPSQEVLDKLGRSYPIHIDHSPVSYTEVWPNRFQITFRAPLERTTTVVPDISISGGKLFLTCRAYSALKDYLKPYGELLPVVYEGGDGVIYNPMKTAEQMNAVVDGLTSYDGGGNLVAFGFNSGAIKGVPVFKTQLDGYTGVFCDEKFKSLVEQHGLHGIYFSSDLANPTGAPYGASH